MKKKVCICIICILIIIISLITIKKIYYDKKTSNTITTSTEQNTENEAQEGMKVTLIGGSNMEDKGNINSCGYIIRSKNGELIIVDGGRDVDAGIILNYIQEYGNGVVNHWYITHAHTDHIGALLSLLNNQDIQIENLYYSFNTDDWYKEHDKRGYETEHAILENLNNPKIKQAISCEKDKKIEMDNIECEIIRTANPEIIDSDNGNEASMVFKMTATDVNKSIIFLGDAFKYTSLELLEIGNGNERLKADAVQMAHHGQNGVSKEVYQLISPQVCFFNCPKYLYDNNFDNRGYNTGGWKTIEVREWVQELGATSYMAFEGDQTINFTSKGIEKIDN